MNTDQLIQTLSKEVPAVPRNALHQRIRLGLYGGGIVATLLVVWLLGTRQDLASAIETFPFWVKFIYSLSLGVGAVVAVGRLARPTPTSLRPLRYLALPVLLLAAIGIVELANTPSHEWLAMWLGRSWKMCPWVVLALAAPMYIGLLWSFRRFAPQRMRAAGAVAGLAAGAWGATIYSLHCQESAAIFVLTWYSLGMVLATTIGAALGTRLLRW